MNEDPLKTYPVIGPDRRTEGDGWYTSIPEDPKDITGGYLFKLEYMTRKGKEDNAYVTRRGQLIRFIDPDRLSQSEYSYITTLLSSFEDAIFAEDGIDPSTGKSYTELCDLTSFALKYLLEETVENYDADHNSQYMYKDRDADDPLIHAGPAWDYDAAYGSYATEKNVQPREATGFWVNAQNDEHAFWWPALYRHADFQEKATELWRERMLPALRVLLGDAEDPSGQLLSIDAYAAKIKKAALMDSTRWAGLNDYSGIAETGSTWRQNVNFLKRFLRERTEWLMTQWGE